jgi:hypothetical protein
MSMLFALAACGNANIFGVDPSQMEKLDARITEIRECIPIGSGCRPGELLSPGFPLDTSAVIWGYRFVLIGYTDFAEHVTWYAEYAECREVGRCGIKHRGPMVPAPNMGWFASILPTGDEDLWIILEAKLKTRVVADTIGFRAPGPKDPPQRWKGGL